MPGQTRVSVAVSMRRLVIISAGCNAIALCAVLESACGMSFSYSYYIVIYRSGISLRKVRSGFRPQFRPLREISPGRHRNDFSSGGDMAQPRDWWIGNAFLIVNSYEGHPKLSCLPQIDKAALDFWKTFHTLRFQTRVRYNRTRQQFESDIGAFIQSVAQDASAKYVVFFFIGHGGAGDTLFLQDGSSVTVKEIDDMFSQLESKYRILIIDACRGQGVDHEQGGYCPKHPNTIVARSTLPHQKAWSVGPYGTLVFRGLYNVASLPILMCSNLSVCMHGAYSRAGHLQHKYLIYLYFVCISSIQAYTHELYLMHC